MRGFVIAKETALCFGLIVDCFGDSIESPRNDKRFGGLPRFGVAESCNDESTHAVIARALPEAIHLIN